jgi:hypothetical protein
MTAEAAAFLRGVLPSASTDEPSGHDVLRIAPAPPDQLRGLKVSFVGCAGEHDSVTLSQGVYLCVDPILARELDDKLIDLTPGGESVYIRSARAETLGRSPAG